MNKAQADALGRLASHNYIRSYLTLLNAGYTDQARAMFLSTFPYAISVCEPSQRTRVIADLLDVYHIIGHEVFEDEMDLYDALLTKPGDRD